MVERIRMLLEVRQLTPTQFADAIGVARPIVSHILSGRNKPSLEVVQRILAAMPDLSMPWLLNGAGPMLAATGTSVPQVVPATPPTPILEPLNKNQAASTVAPVPQVVVPDVVAPQPPAEVAKPKPRPASQPAPAVPRPALKRFSVAPVKAQTAGQEAQPTTEPAASALTPPAPAPQQAPPVLAPVTAAPVSNSDGSAAAGNAAAAAFVSQAEKQIRRIVIFYQDGSFADYQPE